MAKLRDRESGRYVHDWGVVGQRMDEHGYREVARCEHCGRVHAYGAGPDRMYRSEEAARKAGESMTILESGNAPLHSPIPAEEVDALVKRFGGPMDALGDYNPEYQQKTGIARNS